MQKIRQINSQLDPLTKRLNKVRIYLEIEEAQSELDGKVENLRRMLNTINEEVPDNTTIREVELDEYERLQLRVNFLEERQWIRKAAAQNNLPLEELQLQLQQQGKLPVRVEDIKVMKPKLQADVFKLGKNS